MKFIRCDMCHEVIALKHERLVCECGRSWGYYEEDGLHAVIGGAATPLGWANYALKEALIADEQRRFDAPDVVQKHGIRFEAFVIPMPCPTVRREE